MKNAFTILLALVILGGSAAIGIDFFLAQRPPAVLRKIGPLPPLFAAIDRGDVVQVDRLLSAGADPNTTTAFDRATALDHGIWADNAAIVKRLLQAHVDPNRPGMNGETPLISSIIRCKWRAFDALLDGGADANRSMSGAATPLTVLFASGAPIPQMRRLVVCGADPNAVGMDKRTPLETAACAGTPESIDALIQLGAHCGPKEGWSALYWAASNNRLDNIDALVRHGVDPNAVGLDGRTVFQKFVADSYRVKTAWHLVEMGSDPLRPFPDGNTPMNIAGMTNNREMVDLLKAYAENKAKKQNQRADRP